MRDPCPRRRPPAPAEFEEPSPRLTAGDVTLARLVARGLANKQIARELGITDRTVANRLHRAFRKLDVPNRTRFALWVVGQERREE